MENLSKTASACLPVQAGTIGKPGGRPKSRQTMKSIYESMLGRRAPIELCRAFHLPAKSTFAQVIPMATVHRGLRNTSAAKFLVQLTEGPAGLVSRETNQADIEFVEDSGVIGFVSYLPR